MNPKPLDGCYAQTKWAKTAIDQLQAEIGEFVASNPYEIDSNLDLQSGEKVWRLKINRELPDDMQVRVGNILANLRDPLDNVLAILSDRHRGRSDSVAFPFGRQIEHYNTELKKVEKLLPAGAGDLIRAAQTHPGGNAHLRALHFLNRDKKHRIPIALFNMRTTTVSQVLAFSETHMLIRLGFRHGQHLVPVPPTFNLDQSDPAKNPTFIPNQGFVFEPNIEAGDDDMELMTTTPDAKFYAQFKPFLEVAFTKTPGLEREAIGVALHKMRELVEGILLTFERRFFA